MVAWYPRKTGYKEQDTITVTPLPEGDPVLQGAIDVNVPAAGTK